MSEYSSEFNQLVDNDWPNNKTKHRYFPIKDSYLDGILIAFTMSAVEPLKEDP